jgi:hypothetical protein
MGRSAARRRYLRKYHPSLRVALNAAFHAAIDALVDAYWSTHGAGRFMLNGDCEICPTDDLISPRSANI